MKYFELIDTPELKYAPKLANWSEKSDVRKTLGNLFFMKPQERIRFTDFILSPVFLVSQDARKVIELYEEDCTYKEIILLEEISGRSRLYYVPMLYETSELQLMDKENEMVVKRYGCHNADRRVSEAGGHIFVVKDALRRHTIISLELAENLLYRRMSGIGLREVELIYKEKDA